MKKIQNNQQKKFQELVKVTIARLARNKAVIQKSISFLHTSSEQAEFEMKAILPFILASLCKMKIFLYKSNKLCVRPTWKKSYKTLTEDMKELNKWRNIPCSLIGRFNTVMMLGFNYGFNTISIKISASYFMDFNKLILKFIWRVKSCIVAKGVIFVSIDQRSQSQNTWCYSTSRYTRKLQ